MQTTKPTILIFNGFYLPGYRAGGPIRTLANLVERLGDKFDFRIVTGDRDSGDQEPYRDIELNTWNKLGNANVMYVSKNRVSLSQLVSITKIVNPRVIYLNSLFDVTFTRRMLWAKKLKKINIPIVLAPRGELSLEALKIKRFRKRLYLNVSKFSGIYSNIIWQASSHRERKDIILNIKPFNPHHVIEAIDLTSSVAEKIEHINIKKDVAIKLCFLSRISPMKNLDYAINVLEGVKSNVIFTIYGPKSEPKYWEKCQSIISRLPSNIKVAYGNEIHPMNVRDTLSKHDLFFLPTRGENYGHVIHEALSAGLPVLISDRTPWNEVMDRGAGWALSLDNPEAFISTIEEFGKLTTAQIIEARRNALDIAREKVDDELAVEANYGLFTTAIELSEQQC